MAKNILVTGAGTGFGLLGELAPEKLPAVMPAAGRAQ